MPCGLLCEKRKLVMKRKTGNKIGGTVGLLVCLAAVMSFAVGCGSKNESSSDDASKVSQTEKVSDSAAEEDDPEDESGGETADDPKEQIPFEAGEKLAATAKKFEGDYTYAVRSSFSDEPDEQTLAVISKSGSEVYITYTDSKTESDEDKDGKDKKDKKDKNEKNDTGDGEPARAYFFDGSAAYDVDLGMEIYNAREKWEDYNLILSLIESEPEVTEAHMSDEMADKGYSVEEYTYPGDTYITVFDFYFDENDDLKQYTVTYKVEGDDDLVQTCVVEKLEESAEIGENLLDGLTDFSSLDADARGELCLDICEKRGITSEKKSEAGVSDEDISKMDYDAFTEFVYSCGE